MKKEIIEKIKKTIEAAGAPITAIALIWGKDISGYCAATVTFLLSVLNYIEMICPNEVIEKTVVAKKTTKKNKA